MIPIAVTSAALGVLVRLRRPDNLVGWLLLANGLSLASLSLAWPYAYYGGVSHPGSLPGASWAALWTEIGWPGLYVLLMAIAFVFPDGRLPSRRWRWVAIATVVSYVGLELGFALHPGHFDPPFEHLSKPTPSYPAPSSSSGSLSTSGFSPASLPRSSRSAAGCAAQRAPNACRSSGSPTRRCSSRLPSSSTSSPGLVAGGGTDIVTGIGIFAMLIAIPAAVAIGILRYRLFDIELAINRTLVYGTLTLCIVVAYVAVVTGLNALISQSGIAGVLAAGLVAAGVQPLRLRLQRRADRWVYGDRSDPYAALTRLGDRLQGTLAPDQVVQTVVDSVAEALRLRYAAIEFDRDGPR